MKRSNGWIYAAFLLGALALIVGLMAGVAAVFWALWNAVAVPTFGATHLSFWGAWGLWLLIAMVARGFRPLVTVTTRSERGR